MNIDASLREALTRIAKSVHSACRAIYGQTEGSCKEAALALALALDVINEPVCVCQGSVVVDGMERDHYWCRVGHTIVDPTADQFWSGAGPLVADEIQLSQYVESSFFVFSPRAVLRLAAAARA